MMRLGNVTTVLIATSALAIACSAEERTGSAIKSMKGSAVVEDNEAGIVQRKSSAQVTPEATPEQIVISSERGQLVVEIVESEATKLLLAMLPLTIEMRDHLRQEKTGSLPSPLPEQPRQIGFSAGTIGLWGNDDFVIYYKDGSVPPPGIIVLGHVSGDTTIFDVPGPVTVRIEQGH